MRTQSRHLASAPASSWFLTWLFSCLLCALPAAAQPSGQIVDQTVDPSRGTDSRVDYPSLTRLGPWDDRNYQLSQRDLGLLADNEAEMTDPIPAFFRVELRRTWPELRRSGPAQYPRSALQIFRQLHTGYLVDGKFYRRAERVDGRFVVRPTRAAGVLETTAARSSLAASAGSPIPTAPPSRRSRSTR